MPPQDVTSTILGSLVSGGVGQDRRASLQDSANKLFSGARPDDPYIETMESFHGFSHEEIYTHVQLIEPADIDGIAQACHDISNALPLAFGFAVLRNTIAESWEGAAADAATAATQKLAQSSGQLASGLAAIAVKLDILRSTAEDVKASVPQPASSEGVLSELPVSPLAAETSETAREAARLEAVRRLEAIYVPNYRDVGTNVPQLPEPYAPSGDGARSDGVSSPQGTLPYGSNPWGTTDSNTSSASGEGDSSANGENPADGDSAGDESAATSAANAEAAANQGAGAGSGSAAQTAAANAQNAAGAGSQSGSGAGAAGYGGGIGGGSGSGAGGSGIGGSASSARRKNDKRDSESNSSGVVPGGPIPSGGAAAGAGAAAAAAAATPVKPSMSRPGMGMAPGMMGAPGRAGGNGDGDTEHQTPSYLITVDNGNELIGKLDPVAPPVIGA
ncbi:hypothetical protein ACFWAY_35550 [Rhodococcus sp. NPDC059968]